MPTTWCRCLQWQQTDDRHGKCALDAKLPLDQQLPIMIPRHQEMRGVFSRRAPENTAEAQAARTCCCWPY
jgi:hypothetical protein